MPPVAVAPEPPPRAAWSAKPPDGPWCPPEWLDALAAAAPGLAPLREHAPEGELQGMVATSGGWQLLAASRRGRLHAHRGEHREDAAAVATHARGWCAAVADGAGSARFSRLGAAIATHVAAHAIADRLAAGQPMDEALRAGAEATDAALQRFREATGLARRDLRTTLLVACTDGTRLGTLQVGDGATVLLLADGGTVRPHAGDSGDFSGEVTHFLPDEGALAQLVASAAVHDAGAVHGVLMATDGIEDPFYPLPRHAPALFAQVAGAPAGGTAPAEVNGVAAVGHGVALASADPVAALGAWMGFEKRGENDDRTLFIARQRTVPWTAAWAPSPSA